jgi:hypothetical protein
MKGQTDVENLDLTVDQSRPRGRQEMHKDKEDTKKKNVKFWTTKSKF